MNQIRICERCKAAFPLDKTRLFHCTKEKDMLVCEDCCKFLKNMDKRIIPSSKTDTKTKIKAEPKPFYKTKYCSRCEYAFKVDINKVDVLRCPYCGKTDRICEKAE